MLVRLQILEEWRANLEQTNDTEEALIKSQVNYLKFEIFESKISMENSNTENRYASYWFQPSLCPLTSEAV